MNETVQREIEQAIRAGCDARIDYSIMKRIVQLLCDALSEIVRFQPLDPNIWLAEYFRKQQKNTLLLPPILKHRTEYEQQRVLIEKLYVKTKDMRIVMKSLYRNCVDLEKILLVEKEDSQVPLDYLNDDKIPPYIEWCPAPESIESFTNRSVLEDRMKQRFHFGNTQSALQMILPVAINAMIEYLRCLPEDPFEWLSNYFLDHHLQTETGTEMQWEHKSQRLSSKLRQTRHWTEEQEAETARALTLRETLTVEKSQMDAAIDLILVSRLSPLPPLESLEAKYVYVNHMRQYFEENEEDRAELPPLAWARAEKSIMYEDEITTKTWIKNVREYRAMVIIQTNARRFTKRSIYVKLIARRHKAATYLQDRYQERLYRIAMRLPEWCQVGAEVLIAKSISRKAGMSFQFYKGKDFPPGTFATHPEATLDELKNICRNDEGCAGFATDGTLKRFIPHQLSQLVPNKNPTTGGLYVKIIPLDDSSLVNSGILMSIPSNRMESSSVAFDGLGVTQDVPIQKLTWRWDKVFDFQETCWYFVDKVTSTRQKGQPRVYREKMERFAAVQKRKEEYASQLEVEYQKRVVCSAIKLQCAWRARKARQKFLASLNLRDREYEHALLVEQAAAKALKKKKKWFKFR